MTETHLCVGETRRSIFCVICNKVMDLAALKSIKVRGFTGPASINPKIEQFWATGDSSVFEKPSAAA